MVLSALLMICKGLNTTHTHTQTMKILCIKQTLQYTTSPAR